MNTPLKPHAVMVPFPETGHINPLMQLARYLASQGVIITFVNTLYNHERLLRFNKSNLPSDRGLGIRLLGISDGLSEVDNRDNDVALLVKIVENIGPVLEDLIREINQEGPVVTCIISDAAAVKTVDVARRLGIPRVAFWAAAAATYATICHAAAGVRGGSFPASGISKPEEIFRFPGLPPMSGSEFPWLVGSKQDCESIFPPVLGCLEDLRESEWVLCNSVYELEGGLLELLPQGFKRMCPVGPLLPSDFLERNCPRENRITTSLFPENCGCLEWLDSQATGSVLYVSLGSITILEKQQFEEFADGLEASEVPILWVLPENCTGENVASFSSDVEARTSGRMKVVSWAPQLSVLSHRAVGGFLTHCGWNSTIESTSIGVPMLAWPQQVDQHMNAKLVVEKWAIALALIDDEKGLVSRRVDQRVRLFMGDSNETQKLRQNSLKMKEIILRAIKHGGSSFNTLHAFLQWVTHSQVCS